MWETWMYVCGKWEYIDIEIPLKNTIIQTSSKWPNRGKQYAFNLLSLKIAKFFGKCLVFKRCRRDFIFVNDHLAIKTGIALLKKFVNLILILIEILSV